MNTYSITFHTVAGALKRRWKLILISILIFSLLGAGGGFLFSGRGMAQPGGAAGPLKPVDFSLVPHTQDYYTGCLNAVDSTINILNNYLSTVSTCIKAEDGNLNTSGLAEVQQADLDALSGRIQVLKSSRIAPLRSALSEAGAVYAPEEYLDSMAERYAQDLETIQMDLIAAQAAAETVRQMDAPDFDGSFTGSYATLLAQAANYGALLRSQAVMEKYLDNLENHLPAVRAECRRVERELESLQTEANEILNDFALLADSIAKKAGLTFTPNTTDKGSTEIVVTHAHRASSSQESFAVIVLFCVLVGLCLGVFLAVCREAKEEKKRQAESRPQKPDGAG